MRILFVTNFYPPHDLGGMERLCEETVLGLQARGYEAHVLTSGIDGLVFRRGDVADLAAKMQLLVDHPEVVSELAANSPGVRSVDDEVDYIESVYASLLTTPDVAAS